MSQVSDLTTALAASLELKIEDGKVVTNKDAYVNQLAAGIERNKGFDAIVKGINKAVSNNDEAAAAIAVVKDHSADIVKAVHNYDAEFFAGAQLAVGEAAIDYLAANKDIDRTQPIKAKIPTVGRNNLEVIYRNDYTKRIPGRDGAEAVVEAAYGKVTPFYDVVGTRKSGEQIKAVRELLATKAQSIAD